MILVFMVDIIHCTIIFLSLVQKKFQIKNKSFLEDPSKGFELKGVYNTKGENNIENAYDDLVFSNKKVVMFFIKM